MTMIFFTIIFTLLAVACVFGIYLDGKIQKHIFVNHPKLWKSLGYPSNSSWFTDLLAKDVSAYNIAECKLVAFVKSPECNDLGDVELLRLKALNKLVRQIILFIFVCVLIVGCFTFFA